MVSTKLAPNDLRPYIQSTLVRPDVSQQQVVEHIETCAEYNFDAAMIAMCWVPLARDILKGTAVKVATTIGFGMGNESLDAKVALIRECRSLGADEVDYQPNMGYFLSGMYDAFRQEAETLLFAAEGVTLKPMLELGYLLSQKEKRLAATLLDQAGMPWIKNSSGGGPKLSPAIPEDIRFLREIVSSNCKVKASGGIRSYEQAVALIDAGAELLGTSAGVEIVSGSMALSNSY